MNALHDPADPRRGTTPRWLRTTLPLAIAALLVAPAARAQTPPRTCDARGDRRLVRTLSDETERARLWIARGGRDAEAEAALRDVIRRAGGAATVRCLPPAEVVLARALEKQAAGKPEALRDAIALLVGVRDLDATGFPPEWRGAVADAGTKLDDLVRRSLDAGRARLDAQDAPGAEAVARGLRQLFGDVKGGAGPFAAATALLSRALWRGGKRVEARSVGRELESVKLDALDKASAEDVTEALDELRALPTLTVRLHGPPGVALPLTVDGDAVDPGAPVRVAPDQEHRILVDLPGYTRIDEAVRVTGPEELVERIVREAIAPAPPGSSSEDEARFLEGRRAFDERRWLDAAGAFEAARPSPARSYDLARAEEERGVPARAFALFQEVISDKGAAPPWLAAHARRHADATLALLGRVRVDLGAPGAMVTVDGQPLGPITVGGERLHVPGVPADPRGLPGTFQLVVERGRHTFRVAQAGFDPWQTEVDVEASGIVTLRAGDKLVSPVRRSIGIAGTVAGGVGFVLGAGLGIAAINTLDDARADPKLCPAKRCSPAGLAKVDTARSEAWGSTLSFALGVPLLVTGLVIWAPWRSAPKDAPPAAPKVGVTPLVGPGLGGLSLGGSFQ